MSMVRADAIDKEAVLRALNINVRDPKHQAMLLICERYNLDPVLKHVVLISGNAYVTRDGLLHVAHQTGMLDGIVVEDESETDDEWQAKVTVYVKGQTHGYTYRGRYPKSGQQKRYGAEMAVKCAEVMALRRAFGVTGIPTVEEQWDKSDQQAVRPSPPPLPAEVSGGGEPTGPPPPATAPSPGATEPGGEPPAPPATSTAIDVGVVEQPSLAHGDAPAGPASTVGRAAKDSKSSVGSGSDGDHGAGPNTGRSSGEGPHDGHVEAQGTLPAPKDAPEWFSGANRRARAIAKSVLGADSKDAEYVARWEALVWAASGGTTTESKELTREQHAAFVTRLKDCSAGLARIVETGDPQFLGFTLEYREAGS